MIKQTKYCYFFDIETIEDRLWFGYYRARYNPNLGGFFYNFLDWINSFQEAKIKNYGSKRCRTYTLIAHNYNYDCNFIIKELVNVHNWNITNDYENNYKETLYISSEGEKLNELIIWNRWGIKLIFNCSWKNSHKSVESMGIEMGYDKYSFVNNLMKISYLKDYNFFDNIEGREILNKELIYNYIPTKYGNREEVLNLYKQYCRQDVHIVMEYIKKMSSDLNNVLFTIGNYKEQDLAINKSLSSTSLNIVRQFLNDREDRLKISWNKWSNIVKKDNYGKLDYGLYKGGYTEFNRFLCRENNNGKLSVKEIKGDIVYIDINSSYPNQMSKDLPFDYGLKIDQCIDNMTNEDFIIAKVDFDLHPNHPFAILFNYDIDIVQNHIYEANNYQIALWKIEWDFFVKTYNFKVLSHIIYRAKFESGFKDLILPLYKMRENPKYKNVAKLIINSMYGKLGQRKYFANDYFVSIFDPKIEWYEQKLKEDREWLRENRDNIEQKLGETLVVGESISNLKYWRAFKTITIDINETNNVLAASYITSSARVQLFKMMEKIGYDKVIYCDTDSIMFLNDNNQLDIIKDSLSNKLGDWKVEGRFSSCIVYGPKQYLLDGHSNKRIVKWKGLSKDTLDKMDHKQLYDIFFEKDIELKSITKVRTKSGIKLIERDKKFRPKDI